MIQLTLPYPVSANRYWATRVVKSKATGRYMAMTYITPEAREYQRQVAKIAAAAGLTKPLDARVAMHLQLYPHRPQDWQTRQRKLGALWDDSVQCIDLGNAEKVLTDALQGVVVTDDRWFWRFTKERMEPDAAGERVVVRITTLAAAQPQASLIAEAA